MGRNKPRVIDLEQARARYLDARLIRGSNYVVTAKLFPRTSAELRAAADRALVAEMKASIKEPEKC